jgi:hypothetical protein
MRTYRKVWISQDLATVTAHPYNVDSVPIALIVPHSKNQLINAYNFLSLSGGVGWTWQTRDELGNLQTTFTGPQLANDIFTFVPYANHPLN